MRRRHKHAIVAAFLAICLCQASPRAAADPVGDFFKRLGRTLSKPRATPSPQTKRKSSSVGAKAQPSPGSAASPAPAGDQTAPSEAAFATPTPEPAAPPPSTPSQPTTRVAMSAPESATRGDLPYGVPVANRAGFVTSPYAPTRGLVDVRGFPSGTEVKDPYTGKIFRTP